MHARLALTLAPALACAPAATTSPPPVASGTEAPAAVPAARTDPPGPPDQVNATPEPAPAPQPLRPAAGLRLVFETHGWDLVATPDRVVVLDDDFRHLRGHDPATGAELWRVQAQDQPNGRHTLHAVGERVLLFAGPTIIVVDARDGRVIGAHPAGGYNGGDGRCYLQVVRGVGDAPDRRHVPWDSTTTACAIACECSLRVFRCDTGAGLGEVLRSSVTHLYHSLDEPHDNVCWTPPRLLGKVKGRTLLALEREDRDYDAAALAEDGAVLWRKPGLGDAVRRFRDVAGDAGQDRCWSIDGDNLIVWTCSTGQVRWRADYPADPDGITSSAQQAGPDRLLVQRRTRQRNAVELRALADGRRVWQRSLAQDRLVLLPGEEPQAPPWDAPAVYIRLDLATGATLGELPVPAREQLRLDPRGGYVRVRGAELGEYDRELRLVRTVSRDMAHAAWLSEHFLVLSEQKRLIALRRPALEVALDAAGSFSVAESSPTLGPHALLVYEHRDEQPLRIALLRAEP